MKRLLSFTIAAALGTFLLSAQPEKRMSGTTPLQNIAETFNRSEAVSHAVTGLCVLTSDGDTLVAWNAHQRMIPASNMKLLTTGTALLALGPEYSYTTRIGYSGSIENGVLKGDLYLIGGGDPTLGSHDRIAPALSQTFKTWQDFLLEAGIEKIQGHIIGDGSWAEAMPEHGSWSWSDLGTYYGTGVSGLNFFENILAFNVSHGSKPGSPVQIRQTYPQTSWMNFRATCTTGEAGTGDQLYLYTTDLDENAEFRGTFAVDRQTKTIECSNKFPEYTCAVYFKNWLQARGISCSGGAADLGYVFNKKALEARNKLKHGDASAAGSIGRVAGEKADSITIIGKTQSPSLAQIVTTTNHKSNNLFAEVLFLTLGKEFKNSSTYEISGQIMKETLEDLPGCDPEELYITDGSGLSRENFVSPAFLASYLKALLDTPARDVFLNSLPTPSSEGTMQFFMNNYPEPLQNRIRLKSGSMNGVRCYSGYILPSVKGAPTICFSIMVNNFTAPQRQVQKEIEKVIAKLAQQN